MAAAFAYALNESGLTEERFAGKLSEPLPGDPAGVLLDVSGDQVHRWKSRRSILPAWAFHRAARIVGRRMDELRAIANGEPDTQAVKLALLSERDAQREAEINALREQWNEVSEALERALKALGQRAGRD